MYHRGDFHMHSNASDGKNSPKDLVLLAQKHNIDIMAITDHDSTFGTEEAVNAGIALGIRVVPGIELSATHNGESIHMLGYFRDASYKQGEFQNFLQSMINFRTERAKKIVHNLEVYFNIIIDYKKVLSIAHGVVARPHIAKTIIDEGYPYSFDEIFSNYLSNESPAYIPNKKVTIEEGIKLLKSANAFVSLAHPVLIKKSSIDDLLKYDFDGIEAIYPLNTPENTNYFRSKAAQYNKVITAGSDFHGIDNSDTKHKDIASVFLSGIELETFIRELT